MTLLKLKYIHKYLDRAGNVRRYFRKGAKQSPLPGDVGSPEFMTAYQALLGDKPKPTTNIAGSLGLLITEYYASRDFRNLKKSSQKIYRYALEPIAITHGHRNAMISHKQAAKLIGDIGERKPGMANLTKSVLQKLFKYAVHAEWRNDNPMIGISRFKGGTHHTWTEGELQTFEKHWSIGTRQRLAYELLLETAQRIGDVARMRRSDIVDGELHVIQEKTGAELYLPISDRLGRALKAWPSNGLALIGAPNGRPMTTKGLSAMMRQAIMEAALPAKCVSHGLRKAALRRLAEDGATGKQIAAWSGHKTLREVDRYTAAADQRRLAQDARRKGK